MLLQGIYHSILTLHNNHYAPLIKCNFHSSLSALVWMSDCHQLSSLILKTNYASYNTACGPFPRRESSKVQIPLSSNKNNIWVISSTLIQTWLTENVGQLKEALGQMRQNITFCQEISFFLIKCQAEGHQELPDCVKLNQFYVAAQTLVKRKPRAALYFSQPSPVDAPHINFKFKLIHQPHP